MLYLLKNRGNRSVTEEKMNKTIDGESNEVSEILSSRKNSWIHFDDHLTKNSENNNELTIRDFNRNNSLVKRKLLEFLPVMILTNLSNLLLISVDGLVVGNLVSSDALASVNIFAPINSMIGVFSVLSSVGIGAAISNAIGTNNQENINRMKRVSLRFLLIMTAVITFLQLPLIYLVIKLYRLDPEISVMVWQYAVGNMICTPLGFISSVGVCQLQIVGKMKAIMVLSVIEGVSNLLFDLLFVGVFNMGVAGAGFGTACSNMIRATSTVLYLWKCTDMYKNVKGTTAPEDYKELISYGLPDACYFGVSALNSFFVLKILLSAFGNHGGVINAVCTFCFNIAFVFLNGIQGAARPLMGLLLGAKDRKNMKLLMRSAFIIHLVCEGICTLAVFFFPAFFYRQHGIVDIPYGGIASLQLFSLYFVFKGFNALIRQYLSASKDTKFATGITLCGYLQLPVIAFIIFRCFPMQWIWAAYLINEVFLFAVYGTRYWCLQRKVIEEDKRQGRQIVLYMQVSPEDAVEASIAIRNYADEHGIDPKISGCVALCMEEMVAYANSLKEKEDFTVQVMIRFIGNRSAIFVTIDDGRNISLDIEEDKRKLTTNNYELIRRIASTMNYQYILDLNYTTITFDLCDTPAAS